MNSSVKARFGNIKEKNLKSLFNLIADKTGISRAQMAREIGLSKPAVSTLVDELISLGYVNMLGEGKSDQVGRKPISLEINPLYGVFVTVSLNKLHAEYCLYDFALNILERFFVPIEYTDGCLAALMKSIKEKSKYLNGKRVICNCFAIPAVCNYDLTEVRSTVLDIDPNYKFVDELRELKLDGDKILANESVIFAYAEHRYMQRDEDNLIYIEVAEGVGAGIVINDKVFRGVNGSAGEFGHISIDRNGPQCKCGRRGCLELAISEVAVLEKAVSFRIIDSIDAGYTGILKAVADGSAEAQKLLRDMACDLAFGVGNMIAMFDIENIVLGGGIERLGEYFLGMVRSETEKLLIGGTYKKGMKHYINYTRMGNDAKNLGVAKYYCDNILSMTRDLQNDIYFV